jgi:flagellar biogenesis protein FliO
MIQSFFENVGMLILALIAVFGFIALAMWLVVYFGDKN